MGLDRDVHIEVAGRSTAAAVLALPHQTQSHPGLDPGRHLDLDGALTLDAALARALATGVGDHGPLTVTLRAGSGHGEVSLAHPHLAVAATGRAGLGWCLSLAAAAGAGATGFEPGNLEGFLGAKGRLLELDGQPVTKIGPGLGTAPASLATEDIPEPDTKEVSQNVGEVAKGGGIETAKASARDPMVAKLVVASFLVRIGEDGIGFGRLLELLLGLFVTRVSVGMELDGKTAVGGLDLMLARGPDDAENLVVIAFGGHPGGGRIAN